MRFQKWLCMLLLTCVSGCSPSSNQTSDPYESFNRKVFRFNQTIDHAIIAPCAQLYRIILPPFLQLGIHNFFANLRSISYVANDLLQFQMQYALADTWRFTINSTLGLAGTIDVAQKMDLPEHKGQSFGNTLAIWGWQQSAYIVLPILGPSTVRDAFATPLDDWFFDLPRWITPASTRNQWLVARSTSQRAHFLAMDPIIKQAFDPYVFVRNAYLQRRNVIMSNRHYYAIMHEARNNDAS